MQTFLPYPSFLLSAQCLDDKRLGKQRVECLQIAGVLAGQKQGWANHPAVAMWRGHERWLLLYGLKVCRVWRERGFRDTCGGKLADMYPMLPGPFPGDAHDQPPPPWLGDFDFHLSHMSNLVRKKPEHYRHFFPDVPDDLEYIWPKGRGA